MLRVIRRRKTHAPTILSRCPTTRYNNPTGQEWNTKHCALDQRAFHETPPPILSWL